MKQLLLVLAIITLPNLYAQDLEIPDFIDKADIENFDCKCLKEEVKYSKKEQENIDILWKESLQYLKAYAIALTTSTGKCVNSDEAIYETADGHKKMCVMDQRDMQLMVKHIYLVLLNPDKAKKCFATRSDVDWLYSPGGEAKENSEVDQWINRMTFEEFFNQKVTNPEVKKEGLAFAKNFNKMITGDDIVMPNNFPYDISANALPNLWAAVGWFPMYAEEGERNDKNFNTIRGGYAYGEIFGNWGLLQIDEINGEKVGAEVGMTVQAVNTLYPYHNHAISEMYHTIRKPACVNEFKTFAIEANNPAVTTVYEDASIRRVQFNSNVPQEYMMWATGAPDDQPFVYFRQNTIHAFDIDGSCEAKPEEKALVSVWSRSNANDRRNDYGTTHLCECADEPGTPAKKGDVIQCDLTKIKF